MQDKLKLKPKKKLIDLGCGDGKALRFFKNTYDLQSCDGYEVHTYAYIRWKILNKFKKQQWVTLIHKNFFKAKLDQYDYIYVYLLPNQLAHIENRVFSNIKKDAVIMANSFQFAKHKPFETIKNEKWKWVIYLYKK